MGIVYEIYDWPSNALRWSIRATGGAYVNHGTDVKMKSREITSTVPGQKSPVGSLFISKLS